MAYNIGLTGYAAGPNVYIFDVFSLANPVGSHFVVTERGRPGHEKFVSPAWLAGRFGAAAAVATVDHVPPALIVDARAATNCQPLAGYLRTIDAPMNLGRALSNVEHAWTWTTMSYSADPVQARRSLCRGSP